MTAARRMDDRVGVFMRTCLYILLFRLRILESGLYHAVLDCHSFFEEMDRETWDLLCTRPVSTRSGPFALRMYDADQVLP